MEEQLKVIEGLYRITKMRPFRSTPGVTFDLVPWDVLDRVDAVERVIHKFHAMSPGKVGKVKRPWYCHPHQDDHLLVLHGCRHVELFSREHGKIEKLTVYPDCIYKNNVLLQNSGGLVTMPRGVFHRIISGDEGSASLNFATRHPGYDASSNYDIYDVDLETGTSWVIRRGLEDQF